MSKSIIFLENSFSATFIEIWRLFSGHTVVVGGQWVFSLMGLHFSQSKMHIYLISTYLISTDLSFRIPWLIGSRKRRRRKSVGKRIQFRPDRRHSTWTRTWTSGSYPISFPEVSALRKKSVSAFSQLCKVGFTRSTMCFIPFFEMQSIGFALVCTPSWYSPTPIESFRCCTLRGI